MDYKLPGWVLGVLMEEEQCGKYAEGVGRAVQSVAGVRALVVKLSVDHKLPREQICRLYSDLYGYELNSDTVERTLEEGYPLSEPLKAQMKEQLTQAAVVHFDETDVRAEGRLRWLHTACNELYTHLFVPEKRGENALRWPLLWGKVCCSPTTRPNETCARPRSNTK